MHPWVLLGAAIACEVVGTVALKASAGFTRPGPALVVVLGYGAAFWLLSLALRSIPVSVAYAVWSGVGVALIALVSWLFMGERLSPPALLGLLLIIAGVALLNLYGAGSAKA